MREYSVRINSQNKNQIQKLNFAVGFDYEEIGDEFEDLIELLKE